MNSAWIPVTERLPESIEDVLITWVNRKPESYYKHIKDKPFTSFGLCCGGKWHWSTGDGVVLDHLIEYGQCDVYEIDEAIEVTAWMPLPEPYKNENDT